MFTLMEKHSPPHCRILWVCRSVSLRFCRSEGLQFCKSEGLETKPIHVYTNGKALSSPSAADALLNHGKRLLELCRSADLRILNGRVSGDSLGKATFHGRNGTSVVDYSICDQDLFQHVANFIVKEPSCLSDHSPIVTWLNINTNISNRDAIPANDTLTSLPKQFCWEHDSTQKFKDALRSPSTQTLIREFLNDNESPANVNISLKKVENIFIATAKRRLKIKTIKKHKRVQLSTNKKWFDKECRLKRHELRKLANQKHRDPLNVIIREEYHTVLKQYKNLLNNKRMNTTITRFLS